MLTFKKISINFIAGLIFGSGFSYANFIRNRKNAERDIIKWNGSEYMGEITFLQHTENYEKVQYLRNGEYFSPDQRTYVIVERTYNPPHLQIMGFNWAKSLYPDGTTEYFRMTCADGSVFTERLNPDGTHYINKEHAPTGFINW